MPDLDGRGRPDLFTLATQDLRRAGRRLDTAAAQLRMYREAGPHSLDYADMLEDIAYGLLKVMNLLHPVANRIRKGVSDARSNEAT